MSPNGLDWTRVAQDAGFEPVAGSEIQGYDGKLWLLGGGGGWQSFFTTNDIWVLE